MIEKLGKRERRALMIGAACAAAILMVALGTKWFEDWGKTRKELAETRAKLKRISVDEAKQAGLFSIVPVFEMPKAEQDQELLFRDKLNEQLKKVGIRSEPLQALPMQALPSTQGQADYKLLRLKCSAKCQFMQVLDLLAELKQNPYLVGIEEMRIKVATTTRQQPGQRPEGQSPDAQRSEAQGPGRQRPGGQRPEGQSPDGQRPGGQRQEVELNLTVSTYAK
jgi:hypothetical protein